MRLYKLWLLRSSWGPRSVRRTRRTHPSFLQCRVSRSLAERAQGDYYEAVGQYREFVQSLAPPLRAKAAERGFTAMTLARA